ALVCLAASSAGPWSLAALGANGLKDSPLFDAAVYFYLHFQYNGWIFLGLAAVLLALLARGGLELPERPLRALFWLYAAALPPAFLLSVLWPGAPWALRGAAF